MQTADKAVLEVFQKPDDSREEVQEVVRRAVSPGADVGGDARLMLPDERRIKTRYVDIDGQVVPPHHLYCTRLTVPIRQAWL